MDALSDGFRHAFRRLVRRPGLTTATILILALGIGVSTAAFSVARRVLLRPLPVSNLRALTVAWEEDPSQAASLIEVSRRCARLWVRSTPMPKSGASRR